jgi:6,7-dimethyl-8-ribityllumazine synthase
MNERRASRIGAGRRFAVAVAQFNEFFTRHLLDSCVRTLRAHGVRDSDVSVTWVPGSFELAVAAQQLARRGRVDAVICLGCLIRGETAHFDLIAAECARGIADAGRTTGVPVIFGVVTADSIRQAIERCGSKMGNKGGEAAVAAIEMANLMKPARRKRR